MFLKLIIFFYFFLSLIPLVKGQDVQMSANHDIKQGFYLSQIIDCRNQLDESSFIMDREQLYEPTALKVPENLNDYILGQLHTSMPGSKGTIPVIIKIDWLELERKSTLFYLNTKLDFYIRESHSYYYEFSAGDYIEIEKFNSVHDTKFKKQVKNLIGKCYDEFLYRMENNMGYHTPVKESELYRNSLLTEELYQNYEAGNEDGIYYTYNLFRDHIYDALSEFSDVTSDANKYLYNAKLFEFQNSNLNDIYGVQYDGVIYLRKGMRFYPIVKQGYNYFLRTFGILKTKNKQNEEQEFLLKEMTYNAPVIFTVLGWVAFEMINELNEIPDVVFFDHKLDLLTGNILFEKVIKEENQIIGAADDCRIVAFLPDECNTKLEAIFDGKKIANMKTDSYLYLNIPSDKGFVQFCLKSESNMVCDSFDAESSKSLFYEIFIDNKGTVHLEKIFDAHTIQKYNLWAQQGILSRVK